MSPTLLTHFGTVTAPRSITTRTTFHLSTFSTLKAADHLCSAWNTLCSLPQLLISQLLAHIFQRTTIHHQQDASVPVMSTTRELSIYSHHLHLLSTSMAVSRVCFTLTGFDVPHNQHVVQTWRSLSASNQKKSFSAQGSPSE